MAKSTTFLATDPAGNTHKRTSQSRTYAATVVVREGTATAERKFEAAEPDHQKRDADDFAFFLQMSTLDGVKQWHKKGGWTHASEADMQADVARYSERLEGCATAAEYVALQAAERRAAFEKAKAAGAYERWLNAGWCGRSDLALKLAAQQKGYDEVRILPVVVK